MRRIDVGVGAGKRPLKWRVEKDDRGRLTMPVKLGPQPGHFCF